MTSDERLKYLEELETVTLPRFLDDLKALEAIPEGSIDAEYKQHDIDFLKGEIWMLRKEIKKVRAEVGLD
jgi:hypothetical protein